MFQLEYNLLKWYVLIYQLWDFFPWAIIPSPNQLAAFHMLHICLSAIHCNYNKAKLSAKFPMELNANAKK